MTKAGRSTLAVAISLFLVLSLPKLTWAQNPVAYGTWNGYETYTETDYDQFGNVVGQFSGGGNSTLTVDIYGPGPLFSAIVSGPNGFNSFIPYAVSTFGPTSATGFTSGGGYASFAGGFDLSYPAILPDGHIETYGGFADADYSASTFLGQDTKVYFASFNSFSVPEPSAIVPMATGAVVVGTSVVIRRRRVAKHLERARAAVGLEI